MLFKSYSVWGFILSLKNESNDILSTVVVNDIIIYSINLDSINLDSMNNYCH
jgi:hypothetical protein